MTVLLGVLVAIATKALPVADNCATPPDCNVGDVDIELDTLADVVADRGTWVPDDVCRPFDEICVTVSNNVSFSVNVVVTIIEDMEIEVAEA